MRLCDTVTKTNNGASREANDGKLAHCLNDVQVPCGRHGYRSEVAITAIGLDNGDLVSVIF